MKAKIICTIGPASGSRDIIRELIASGMAVARINFSHSKKDEARQRIGIIRELSSEMNKEIKIMGDLQGPKIRLGYLKELPVQVENGNKLIITTESILGDASIISVDYTRLHEFVAPGDRIFLDDGRIELLVEEVKGRQVHCLVVMGGEINPRKGLCVMDKILPLPGITPQDEQDIAFALEVGLDWLAHSFVRNAGHVRQVRSIMQENGGTASVIAKIEDGEGFSNIDSIIAESDGIMVARGDLGVSVERAIVPLIQKKIIEKCNLAGKPEIVATQILESMIERPYPTRAEVNDAAVAVMQGADYLMLSGETAMGRYPVQAVREIKRIIEVIEKG